MRRFTLLADIVPTWPDGPAWADGPTPGQGWSEQGYLRLVGILIGVGILWFAIRSIFGKKK
ncbi:hypothetical protein AB0H43_15575 [Hamadaea sp. NPDC050747]|uniref:hypothetical protein n=1 Tax=Hamadaea sp. NPDC050747 TaxID=3155789 RepID=UPI0033BFF715